MENKLGISDLKDVVISFCRLINASDASLKDGKLNFMDVMHFVEPLKSIPSAVIGISNVIPEIKDLTAVERLEIKEVIASELNVASDLIEEVVEEIIYSALGFYSMFQKVRNIVKGQR